MRKCCLLIALLFIAAASLGVLLPTQPPVCTATPPAQAMAAGYTKLIYCNQMNTITGNIDLNNTANPWFLLYMSGFGTVTPPSAISLSGNVIVSNPNENQTGPYSVYITPSSYGGFTITGGFYIEIDAAYDPTVCEAPGPNSWPGPVFLSYPNALTNHNYDGAQFTEFDIFEYINCAGVMTLHDWTNINPQTHNCQNSNNSSSFVPPNSGFNTYGGIFIPANGATGSFEWFVNNLIQTGNTVTYSASAKPNPAGSCPVGAYSAADAQLWFFAIQGGTTSPVTFRNLHIWQKP